MIFQHFQKITIIRTRKPVHSDINAKLQFFGTSLGLFNLRDKDKSQFRIFLELLKATKKNSPLTSDQVAEKLKLSRGTVVHHINKLIESGIVINMKNHYMLRVNNLEVLIDEIEKDIKRNLEDLRSVAGDIDKRLGI